MAGDKGEKQMPADGPLLNPQPCWPLDFSAITRLIPVWFTAPRREKLSAGAGVVMGRGVLSELLHRHLLHAVMHLWDTHAPPSLHSPLHWLLTALNCSKECCGVGFQTSSYLRQTSQDWFPLWLWTVRKAIHRSSVGQLDHTTGRFHLSSLGG